MLFNGEYSSSATSYVVDHLKVEEVFQARTRTTLIMKREQNEAPTVIVLPPNIEVNQFPESSRESSSSPSSFLNGESLMSCLLHMLV